MKPANKRLYLDYYGKNKIIPVVNIKPKKNSYKLINKKILNIMSQLNKKNKVYKSLNEFINFNPKYNNLKYFKSFWGHCTNQVVIFK